MMAQITCPKCGGNAHSGSYKAWQIIVAICFFPIGLLALLAEKEPNKCNDCGNAWY